MIKYDTLVNVRKKMSRFKITGRNIHSARSMQVYTDHVCTGIFESVKEWRYKG